MAKILYGVAGEGMGHAVRSEAVIRHLLKNHEVKVVASSKAYHYLSGIFDVKEIDYFKIIYRNNKAANFLTFFNNLVRFPIIIFRGWEIKAIIKKFKPDVIITDFEPLVDYFAFFKKIPVISIDNQHIITKADIGEISRGYWLYKLLTKIVIKIFIIRSNKYFINTFYNIKIKYKNVVMVKPLLRKEIFNLRPKFGNHILVYQTSKSNKKLIEELKKINEKFIVYGFYENKKIGNVVLKKKGEKEFLEDLRTCQAVITNGGFTLISEALFLKKPVLSIPVEKQFEQVLNALLLEKTGYGKFSKETNKESIAEFIENIPKFRKKLGKYKKYTNDAALRGIENTIRLLS